MRAQIVILMLLIGSAALADDSVTFIACPIYRDADSGRKSGCWLADDPATQIRYDVSAAPMKAQRGRMVLVEGVVSKDADACGGVTLRPVRTATLEMECSAVMLPAEGYPGRRFNVPPDAQRPTWEPRELPPPPYVEKSFDIFFDFNSDFLIYQHAEIVMEKVVLYAKASRAREVVVTGFAAAEPLRVSGAQFRESQALAQSRAAVVSESLRRLGIAVTVLRTRISTKPSIVSSEHAPTAESSKRRVTIRVIPGVGS